MEEEEEEGRSKRSLEGLKAAQPQVGSARSGAGEWLPAARAVSWSHGAGRFMKPGGHFEGGTF